MYKMFPGIRCSKSNAARILNFYHSERKKGVYIDYNNKHQSDLNSRHTARFDIYRMNKNYELEIHL